MRHRLTQDMAARFIHKAKTLKYNGLQDIGERRELRVELQNATNLTELEALNIVNGQNVEDILMNSAIREQMERWKEQDGAKV